MEIERKFLIKEMPDLSKYPCKHFVQGYLCTSPTVRVRREGEEYFLTYKSRAGEDALSREEYNLPLTKEAFEKLLPKCDGTVISKTRYFIPLGKNREGSGLTAELDVFDAPFEGLVFTEVEFPTVEEARSFEAPDWFGEDVTDDRRYYNSYLSEAGSLRDFQ
ncbi:MAG: CYTH domain-containing protein [Lachnospiraceae bacterium]|nr:CYTH domain-containing protein [Lachnospiraceae bacterium]